MIREIGAWIYGAPLTATSPRLLKQEKHTLFYLNEMTRSSPALFEKKKRKAYTQNFLDQQESSCIPAAHQHLE